MHSAHFKEVQNVAVNLLFEIKSHETASRQKMSLFKKLQNIEGLCECCNLLFSRNSSEHSQLKGHNSLFSEEATQAFDTLF